MRHLGARCADQLVAAGSARQRLRDLLKCAWPAVLRTAAGPLDALTRRAAMAVSTDPERIVAMGYDAFAAAVREELPHWGSTAATCAFCARSNRLRAILAASPPSGPQPVSGPPTHSMTGATPWASSPTSSPAWSRSSGRSGAKSGDHTHGAMRIRRTLPQGEWEVLNHRSSPRVHRLGHLPCQPGPQRRQHPSDGSPARHRSRPGGRATHCCRAWPPAAPAAASWPSTTTDRPSPPPATTAPAPASSSRAAPDTCASACGLAIDTAVSEAFR